jgi:hypothetical protein
MAASWSTQGASRGTAGLTKPEVRAFIRICTGGPRVRVAPTHARALLRERLVYMVAHSGRTFWHLTKSGREAAEKRDA